MPLTKIIEVSQTIFIAVWKIAETEEFFFNSLQLLSEDELKIKSIKLQKIRLQKLACRAALAKLLNTKQIAITYSKTGQPQLSEHYISFSHTKNYVAVALANIPIGIDIEEITPRILPLYTRFMSKQEIAGCDISNLKNFYYYWCAKEAMYKWFTKKNLDFIKDLFVDKKNNKGVINNNNTVQLFDFYFENHIIVFCI
ncbi:MAG: 4'-phosphopantetheinyl transferase superfamily protein [Lentimicrobiaceae bacterium]|nr:4'-phosphopantetheinyl transferase superfamily protein [Lentimicrobiaceae bacterium]